MPSNFYEQTTPAWCIEAVPRPHKRWLSFLSVRFVTVLFSLIGLICFAWGYPQQQDGGIAYGDGPTASLACSNLGTAAYGFAWSSIFILVVVIFNCAVHPGASITFDFLACAAQACTSVWYIYELEHYYDFRRPSSYGKGDEKKLVRVEAFATIVILLSAICHVQRKRGIQNTKFVMESA
ncbi:hypothetical protein MW887_004461 [Aspergillus wentii]|nr:hypothetical protein MW887_004461 [Aspergillus wentii]